MKSIKEYAEEMVPYHYEAIPSAPCTPAVDVTWTQEQIVNTLKQSVDDIWQFHLNTNNYIIHIALDECYHQLLGSVDQLIEALKSFNTGLIVRKESMLNIDDYEGEPGRYLGQLRSILYYGKENYWNSFGEIMSICDNIDQTISRACYMIHNLSNPNVPAFPSLADYAKKCDACC